jgi:hypothetical protein
VTCQPAETCYSCLTGSDCDVMLGVCENNEQWCYPGDDGCYFTELECYQQTCGLSLEVGCHYI